MRIETLLSSEIEEEIEELRHLKVGTEEYKAAVDGITKLTEKVIEFKKIEFESEDRFNDRENDTNLKYRQIDEEKKDQRIKNVISCMNIILPLAVTIWGAKRSWAFEKEDIVTTTMGKGFMNKLLPKK